jgi:hypothetical protein
MLRVLDVLLAYVRIYRMHHRSVPFLIHTHAPNFYFSAAQDLCMLARSVS